MGNKASCQILLKNQTMKTYSSNITLSLEKFIALLLRKNFTNAYGIESMFRNKTVKPFIDSIELNSHTMELGRRETHDQPFIRKLITYLCQLNIKPVTLPVLENENIFNNSVIDETPGTSENRNHSLNTNLGYNPPNRNPNNHIGNTGLCSLGNKTLVCNDDIKIYYVNINTIANKIDVFTDLINKNYFDIIC